MSSKVFVFDLDGVLVDSSHRLDLVYEDVDLYYSKIPQDRPYESIKRVLLALEPDHQIVILTGRGADKKEITETWLHKHRIPFDKLIMRPKDWTDPISDFKTSVLLDIITRGDIIVGFFDDNPLTVEAARDAGVDATYIYSGYYENFDPLEQYAW